MKTECGISNKSLSDAELVLLAREGDAAAFSILSDRYMPVLKGSAGRYAGIVGVDIEDFMQEGMLALFRAVRGFNSRSGTQFSTYAITCINNSMSSAVKLHLRGSRQNSNMYIDEMDERFLANESTFPRQDKPVEDLYIDRETSLIRAQQIEKLLSAFEQRVLRLYLTGHTYQQIAHVLGTSTKSVDNALQRARRKLRP